MSYDRPVTADEKRWRAEDDAHTLARAEEIKDDKARMDAAAQAAKRMADEEAERMKNMRKVARKKPSTSSTPKTSKRVVKKPAKGPDSFNIFQRI